MQIVIYSLLIVSVLGLSAFLYLHIRRQYKTQGLSLADKTNIVMTVVNIVLLVLAVLSIHIALKSYQAAQESGTQQQRTLEASKDTLSSLVGVLKSQQGTLDDSRRALKESVDIITEQKKLLQQSVETSRNQLAVLDAQWKRELEQPDLHAVLIYPAKPAVGVINRSKIKPAKDGVYEIRMLNINRWLGDRYQMVQAWRKLDTLRAKGGHLPTSLELRLDPDQSLEKGARLYGYLSISCPDCVTKRQYWVLIMYGERGWFAEVPNDDPEYSLITLMNFAPSTVEKHVNRFLSRKDLIPMPTRPPW